MSRADKLRERARRLVEVVMMSDENFSQDFLQGVRADVHRWELKAWELDKERNQKSRHLSDD